MATDDWTADELRAAVEAQTEVARGPMTVAEACELLVAGQLRGRSRNSIRRRLTHVRMLRTALRGGEGIDGVIARTNVGRQVAETLAKLIQDSESQSGAPDGPPTHESFGGTWYFVNTDASSLGGVSPHDGWFAHGMAFTGGDRKYGELLDQLAVGDTVLMWANGSGVVGVGRVTEAWDGKGYDQPLVYVPPHSDVEYRLPVEWLVDLRAKPLRAGVIGFNPVRAVERLGEARRARLEALLDRTTDPVKVWWYPRRVPDAKAFVQALREVEPRVSHLHRRLLAVQYAQPERAVSGAGFAALMGMGVGAINLHYGGLGRLVGEALDLRPPRQEGNARWWNVLSWCPQCKPFVWQMQQPLVEALEALGWVNTLDSAGADEVPGDDIGFIEGGRRRVEVNAYERDPAARRACVAYHGSVCAVCGFNFEVAYGEVGRGYIHVHHVRPVSTLGPGYAVDPVTDMVPVCPNCHAMLHRRSPPLTPEELRRLIEAADRR